MPLTELAVEYFRDAAPKQFGRVDMGFASSVGRKAYASPCSLIVGMNYVRRLKCGNPEYLQQISSSDLFLISVLIASKYLYDEGTDEEVFNDEWADAADLEVDDVNQLEREFLKEMDWNLFMSEKEFSDVLRKVEMTIAFRKGRERGNFSYTDLDALTDNPTLLSALHAVGVELCKVVCVCSVAYVACAMILALSPVALSLVSSCVDQATARPDVRPREPSSCKHSVPQCLTGADETCQQNFNIDNMYADSLAHQPSIVSVIKDFIGLWIVPTSPPDKMPQGWLVCEFGPCGFHQQSVTLSCVNVTSPSTSCTSVPCCCCQTLPSLNNPHTMKLPYATVTAFG